jgi:predicted TIM-barrel fold metal-dependent hydrolase
MKYAPYTPLLLLMLLPTGCAQLPTRYSEADFAAEPKIDVHVHINSGSDALIEQARADGFRLLTINVDYPDFPPIPEQLSVARADVRQHPEIVAFAATFSMQGWDDAGWQGRVQGELDAAFAAGAVGIKVWKNIGMEFRDRAGQLVMIDDARFDAIFEQVRQRGKVLIGHQGEPHNCWLPLEQMTVNNDREYFQEHPQYHMFLHPELPSYEAQMAARDRMLTRHPQLHFMGAHLASLEWSFAQLARFLDRYPLAQVDVAARMGQVQYQSNRDHAAVRAFFIKYQDRLLYGTDLTQDAAADNNALRKEAHERWISDWRYFNTGETQKVAELAEPVPGLELPRAVVDKLYYRNAERLFGQAWKPKRTEGAR